MKFVVVAAFVVGLVVVESCSPTPTTTKTATTTTVAPGRKRRSADPIEVILHSKLPASKGEDLLEKLEKAATSQNLDIEKFGKIEQAIGFDADDNVELIHTLDSDVDCNEVRSATKKIISKVPEISRASVKCHGQQFRV
ncbi:unnamed protein product [Bursaphelenchus xylophilus]|uniref:(pine wood nematode) hypothetical protein n=1 Tax=Bursaphelenchus xylophilus TaxID=6326 RepID=A0A1I7RIC3_BURXY|nr:unnamed protein product [Bursaphelenchus xylophilus]CAG9114995.1 unnamed protein product [Bursaphelenchus xylophilus]